MFRILIFSDSRYRDAFGSTWLMCNIRQEISESIVQVASFNYWKDAVENFKPHLVVINHIQGKRNHLIANYVKRHGGLVVVMYNEGVIEFSGREEVFANQKDDDDVDLYLCWNSITANLVGGEVVGCPRFDIYVEPLNKLIDSRELFCDKHGINPDREIILFGSSYPSSKFTYMLQSFHMQNWTDLGNVRAETWRNPKKFAQQQQYEQNKFKSIMLATILERKDSQIVFSPHPMSDIDKWRRFCLEEDIIMINQDYIFNMLNACDLYVGKLGSIAVAEAWLLGKPAVKYSGIEPSASSEDQAKADSGNGTHILETLEKIMEYDDWRDVGERHGIPTSKHWEYLNKWGIAPTNSGPIVALMIKELLEDREPKTIGDVNAFRYLQVVNEHDSNHSGYTVDGYGNYNKAVRQDDIGNWDERISKIFI